MDAAHNAVLVADTEERQVTALLLSGKHRFVASSDPAVLHPVRGVGGPDAVWTSKVFDAGIRAHFGRMTWVADGHARALHAHGQHQGAGRDLERVEQAGGGSRAGQSPPGTIPAGARALEPRPEGGAARAQ